jgi:alkanesulfonate monooxygenase SsuD/methylene tetrahydromethanopterin reductase-like flavin-dependent oxidoreductase (luciferase family)
MDGMVARSAMNNGNRLKIGLFGMNCSSGRTITRIPERWSGDWDDNLAVALLADAAGIDFLLPIARFKGHGGDTDYQGTTFETLTWASALLAHTKRITIFGTVHAPLFHPLIAAKQVVTADHVSRGRVGLNVVCGWNEGEFAMFGIDKREHEARYRHGQEWLDIVKLAWERDDFDFDGEFFKLRGVREKPKPYGGNRPLIMNAGNSPVGRGFALRNCDAFFTGSSIKTFAEHELVSAANIVRSAKTEAAVHGRELDVYTVGAVVCRPTRRDAEDAVRHYTENADWAVIDTMVAMLGRKPETEAELAQVRQNFVNGHSAIKLFGDPDDVTNGLAKICAAGFTGIAVNFVNFLEDFALFRDEVLPRLERLGVRRPEEAPQT